MTILGGQVPASPDHRRQLIAVFVILLLGLVAWWFQGADASQVSASAPPRAASTGNTTAFLPFIAKAYVPPVNLYRFGITAVRQPIDAYPQTTLAAMRFGFYLDYGVRSNPPQPPGMEYVQLVDVKQWKTNNGVWTEQCVGCPYATDPLTTTFNNYTYTFSPDIHTIQSAAQSRPGSTWLLGNEMERIDWAGGRMDEIVPELYADFYHQLYAAIKAADPTAQVAIGGVIEATPLRLQYLTQMWDYYNTKYSGPMPVDIWNIHEMILYEKSCALFPNDCWGAEIPAGVNWPSGVGETYGGTVGGAAQLANKSFNQYGIPHIRAMRQWMLDRGQQAKPLVISEFSVLFPEWYTFNNGATYPFTADQVRDSYMYPAFNYFLNTGKDCTLSSIDGCALVQRWVWFSLDYDARSIQGVNGPLLQTIGGNLLYSGFEPGPTGITPLGTYWIQYVQGLPTGYAKPYAPARPPAAVTRSPLTLTSAQTTYPVALDCSGQPAIRQTYIDLSPSGAAMASLTKQPAAPLRVTKEVTTCLAPK